MSEQLLGLLKPCFGVKIVYNCVLWSIKKQQPEKLRKVPLQKSLTQICHRLAFAPLRPIMYKLEITQTEVN